MVIIGRVEQIGKRLPKYEYRCGGSLINKWYVLTAGHCYLNPNLPKEIVNVGDYNLKERRDCADGFTSGPSCIPDNQIIKVQKIITHEDFYYRRGSDPKNDITLLKLATKVDMDKNKYIKFVCLPLGLPEEFRVIRAKDYMEALVGIRANAVGWGYTDLSFTSTETQTVKSATDILQVVDLPILSNSKCEEYYGSVSFADGKRVCAGAEKGKDSCKGDSGGPLVINRINKRLKNLITTHEDSVWIQIGVTSFGSSACGNGKPGVYTRVSEYIDWIRANIK